MALMNPTEQCLLPDEYEYKIISFEQNEANNFTLSFKIKNIKTEDDVKKWLNDYQEKSKFTWRTARTYKSLGKLDIWRCDYRCQHKTDARYRGIGKRLSKHTDCPATMKIIIKRYFHLPNQKEPDEETRMFPCITHLHSWHNHSSNSPSILRFRNMSSATREKLIHLFRTGHTPTAALHALRTELMLENSDNYHLIAADSSILPSLSIIHHLFNDTVSKTSSADISKTSSAEQGCNIINDVQEFIQSYCDNTGGKAAVRAIESTHIVIALSTPIMQRTIECLPQVHELVLVESSGSMNKLNHRVCFFLTPTVAGGAPIGCIITNSEKESVFKAGVELLNTCLPTSFKNGPNFFMIDGDLVERKVLCDMWPESQLLLCQFHVLKDAWGWIADAKHSICKEYQPLVYFLIKDLVYSETEEILYEKFNDLQLKFPNEMFQAYILDIWENRHLWASCYRSDLPIRDNNTNYYIEALFRILNDFMLNRVKWHNLIQLIDFLVNKYELYLHQRYLDFSCGRYSECLLKLFITESKGLIPKDNIEFDEKKNAYIIQSNEEVYFVDLHNCFCSCYSKSIRQVCKHIASVVYFENLRLNSKSLYSKSQKSTMYKIATGKEIEKKCSITLTHNSNAPEQLDDDDEQSNLSASSDDERIYFDACSSESDNNEILNSDINVNEQEKIKEKLDKWCSKLYYGLEHNPETYIPAIKKMLSNTEKYASTETGLISALHNFSKYEGPTAIGRRTLSQKRKMSAYLGLGDI